ncbi:microfibril-associated glycoprotein 4-like [Asterias amurensis]|uniref:microfibril-associated glycoprotein 4-like n=1 Tax=Asterias amurensis TaxID=7602 RepID=UPI003AB37765
MWVSLCAACFVAMIHVALLLSGQVEWLDSQCGGFHHQMFSAENRALKHSTFMKKTVSNHVICGRDCYIDKNCKSFNFDKCSKLCELNNGTRALHPEDFLEDQGSVYFDTDEDTVFFSLPDSSAHHYKSCKELLEACHFKSDVYVIYPEGLSDGLEVYCDMETDGGGWIVFQRRQDGSVDFFRTWAEYKSGFGNLSGEFWLGNDNLMTLTSDDSQGPWELRVDLYDNNETAFEKYKDFKIVGENYTLEFGAYDASSTAGNSLYWDNGMPFSTMDNDNDKWIHNMATRHKGAWWFGEGLNSHLNGIFYPSGLYAHEHGIMWPAWRSHPLSKCSMKIR